MAEQENMGETKRHGKTGIGEIKQRNRRAMINMKTVSKLDGEG